MSDWILLLACVAIVGAFLVYATRRGWVSWKGGRGIATITAFHDFQPKNKQEAIEYVIEEHAGKKMEEQKTAGTKVP